MNHQQPNIQVTQQQSKNKVNGSSANSQAMESRSSSSSNATGQDPKSGRRPMNAFLLFCKRHRAIVKEKHPHLENRLISKILGEWWTSLDIAEKSKFNTLATEYKEHLMRQQPNYSHNKRQHQPVQHVPVTQSASMNHPSINSVKPKGENTIAPTNVTNVVPEQHGNQIQIVQLQQRGGNREKSQKAMNSSVVQGSASTNKSRMVSRGSSSSSPEPSSPADGTSTNSNSNSNAPLGSGVNTDSNSATSQKDGETTPKTLLHFKKRYLAAEKAKIATSNSTANSSNSCSPKTQEERMLLENGHHGTENVNASSSQGTSSEEACEALLQLAGSGQNPAPKHARSLANSRSRSGTSSPTELGTANSVSGAMPDQNQSDAIKDQVNGSSNGNRYKIQRQEVAGVREAVLTRIAKTLLMQQTKEEAEEGGQGDKPINLSNSSHLQIHGQTIIEHVIENILDKPSEFELNTKRVSEQSSKEGSKSPNDRTNNGLNECYHLNNNATTNGVGMKGSTIDTSSSQRVGNSEGSYKSVCDVTEEQVKERIYESLKQDIMRRNAEKSCKEEINEQDKLRWKTLPHQNIIPTEPQKQQQTLTVNVTSGSTPLLSKSSSTKNDKVGNLDLKQQHTISSTQSISSNSVTTVTKPSGHIPQVVNQKQMSGLSVSKTNYAPDAHLTITQLAEPAVHHQQQLQIFTTSVPPGHTSGHVSSIRNSNQQPPVSVTLVTESGSTGPGNAYGPSVHHVDQVQIQDAHANDVPLNLSTTPPQTPAGMSSVTITASPTKRCRLLTDEEDDTHHQRNERACKGRRYQEFKDQALGRKGSRTNHSRHRSGDRNSLDGNDTRSSLVEPATTASFGCQGNVVHASQLLEQQNVCTLPSSVQKEQQGISVTVPTIQPFDVEKELKAIPALSLEVFQQRVLNSRQQQAHGHGRIASISPSQNSVSVSLTPGTVVTTNHLGVGTSIASLPQASMAIVTAQSSPSVSYHPQTLVVTKQPPAGTIVATGGLPLTIIGSKRPHSSAGNTIPSVVPVITATAISSYQHTPQEQHQMQLQHVGRGGGKFSKRISTAGGQES